MIKSQDDIAALTKQQAFDIFTALLLFFPFGTIDEYKENGRKRRRAIVHVAQQVNSRVLALARQAGFYPDRILIEGDGVWLNICFEELDP